MSSEVQGDSYLEWWFREQDAENTADAFFESIRQPTDEIEFTLDSSKLAKFYEALEVHTGTINAENAVSDGRATATAIIQKAYSKNIKLWRIVQVLSTLALPNEGECHIPEDLLDSELTLSAKKRYSIKFIRVVRKVVLEESKKG